MTTDRFRTLLLMALLAGGVAVTGGCGPGEQSEVPATAPATASRPEETGSPPPSPQPLESASVLYFKEVSDPRRNDVSAEPIEPDDFDRSVGFAGARLKLIGRGGHQVVAVLHSEDPPDPNGDASNVSRFYFRMPLQLTDRTLLDGARYRLSLELNGAEEISDGIYLRGDQEQLQPIDLLVTFEAKEGIATIRLKGLFKYVDTDSPQAETRWFHIKGTMRSRIE